MNLFRIAGIRLAVHNSFLLLLAYVAWQGAKEGGLFGALEAIVLVLAFFVCVVLHELGHSAAAMRFGVRVPRILLMPIGGMAEFDSIPRQPSKEIAIALAGPAVNFAIIALLWGFVRFPSSWENDPAWEGVNGFLMQLFLANLLMGTFNLLPAFPMDGGRVLRALLAIRLPYLKATFIASLVGKVLACALSAFAFWNSFWLLGILFLFIVFVGEAEYRSVKRAEFHAEQMKTFMRRYDIQRASTEAPDPTAQPPGENEPYR
jgi:Zn-dependent protease